MSIRRAYSPEGQETSPSRSWLMIALLVSTGCAPAGRQWPRVSASQASATRLLLFHESMATLSDGPYRVDLDSGVVYRLEVSGDAGAVFVAAPTLSSPPVTFAAVIEGRGIGVPFMAPYPGAYRVVTESPTNGTVTVRIFREASDQASLACVRTPRSARCRGEPGRPAANRLLALLFIPFAMAIWMHGYW